MRTVKTYTAGEVFSFLPAPPPARAPQAAPVQLFIPGSGPVMPPGKIRAEHYPDNAEYLEGFTAQPETPALFPQEDK